MSTFEQCLSSLNDLFGLLETFNAASLDVLPLDQENPEAGYRFHVGFASAPAAAFPAEFNGIPVTTHVISPGYRDRMNGIELE